MLIFAKIQFFCFSTIAFCTILCKLCVFVACVAVIFNKLQQSGAASVENKNEE